MLTCVKQRRLAPQAIKDRYRRVAGVLTILTATCLARGGSITITLPPGTTVVTATATTEKEPAATITGTVTPTSVTFVDPTPGMPYEAKLTLKEGTVLQGADMGWYASRVPDKPNAEPLNDDDRQQMLDVLNKVQSFFNVNEMTLLKGNHNRAVMLVRLERTDFHSDKGDEVIWRPELWYFQNNHGGWEKVQQTDRNLRRERFATHADYHAVVDHLRWVPELGGLKVTPKTPELKVELPAGAGVPALPPATQPASK
jgi:hypothetical protein